MDTEHPRPLFRLHDLWHSPGTELDKEVVATNGVNAADMRYMLRMGKTQEIRVR